MWQKRENYFGYQNKWWSQKVAEFGDNWDPQLSPAVCALIFSLPLISSPFLISSFYILCLYFQGNDIFLLSTNLVSAFYFSLSFSVVSQDEQSSCHPVHHFPRGKCPGLDTNANHGTNTEGAPTWGIPRPGTGHEVVEDTLQEAV